MTTDSNIIPPMMDDVNSGTTNNIPPVTVIARNSIRIGLSQYPIIPVPNPIIPIDEVITISEAAKAASATGGVISARIPK